MAIRWPIANAIVAAENFLQSKHETDEDKQADALWADVCKRYPEAASLLLLLAQAPGHEFLYYSALCAQSRDAISS